DWGSDLCPVTWLSFADAKLMAEGLGGSLPTVEQWKAAEPRAGSVRRLRSTAWQNQLAHLDKASDLPAAAARLPDAGSFSKNPGLMGRGNFAYLSDKSVASGAINDGALWLRSVFPANETKWDSFHHLIGNAAEWVNAGTESAPKAAIMGGSVVSPPALPNTTPLTPPNTGPAFDLTFRLVVRTGAGGAGAGLKAFKDAAAAIPAPEAPVTQ
ncbi:MAG: hypothetical protein ABMA01_15735, partial [Chthoniobacteraceae bacterium]